MPTSLTQRRTSRSALRTVHGRWLNYLYCTHNYLLSLPEHVSSPINGRVRSSPLFPPTPSIVPFRRYGRLPQVMANLLWYEGERICGSEERFRMNSRQSSPFRCCVITSPKFRTVACTVYCTRCETTVSLNVIAVAVPLAGLSQLIRRLAAGPCNLWWRLI